MLVVIFGTTTITGRTMVFGRISPGDIQRVVAALCPVQQMGLADPQAETSTTGEIAVRYA